MSTYCEKEFSMTVNPDWFNDIPWWTQATPTGDAVATVTAFQETATLVSSIPVTSDGGSGAPIYATFYPGYGPGPGYALTITNPGLDKICHIAVVVKTVNDVPPSTNGIQHGSDTIYFTRVNVGYVPIDVRLNVNGQIVTGTFENDFTAPNGVSYWCGLFRTTIGVAGPGPPTDYNGGSIDWSINFTFV